MVSIDTIKGYVEDWAAKNIGGGFSFRPNQLEAIVGIINNIENKGVATTVVQAPTGTGKSLMCIIAAGVLAKHFKKQSYILASDLYLWEQYYQAITKYKLSDFGFLKGSIGNYKCFRNGLDYHQGVCRQKRVGLTTLRHEASRRQAGYSCAETCLYMRQRFRAEMTPVSLLTYQLWLYQMNLVAKPAGSDESRFAEGFKRRPVIFCDECHNIPDIIERYAQPTVDVAADRDRLSKILEFAQDHDVRLDEYDPEYVKPGVEKSMECDETFSSSKMAFGDAADPDRVLAEYDYFTECLDIAFKMDCRPHVKVDLLEDYCGMLRFADSAAEACLDWIKDNADSEHKDRTGETAAEKSERKSSDSSFSVLSWMHNYASMFQMFLDAATSAGEEYIVLERSEARGTGAVSYVFNCVKEDYLCDKFLLSNADFKVMTSATVGDKAAFADNIGVKYSDNGSVEFDDVPNFFDFSRSPVYVMTKYKMSYANKRQSFPEIQKIIFKILSSKQFKDKRGMINTGSYKNAWEIYDAAPPEIKRRLCIYNSSKDKDATIQRYKRGQNKVIIGPTLVEGVDLPGDYCRFIIIAKVPYPNISSETVKAKMSVFPKWYMSTTSNTVIQNIGRGVRNADDYCVTFILDGCFKNLYESTIQQYPPELRQRFRLLNG